ncbi:MAG: PSD1 and planctomycete cytochrome C domain-containing protein [Planctomycetaceae bacterium]
MPHRLSAAVCVLLVFASARENSAADRVDFNRQIRPLLARNCFACHGPDEQARKAKLRLDQRETAVTARAIVPGKPDESELISRIQSTDPDLQMPPPGSGHTLTSEEKLLLREWIAESAGYEIPWSFQPPRKRPLPAVQHKAWPRHAIDFFALHTLEEKKLLPSAEADRYQLIRRVSLDLTGLPPTPEQADTFVADKSETAYASVVDRLLASDAYGEHWARMWLDLARYADTKGYEKDRPRNIWRYRDWVIAALNRDLPYDRFTIEQLAGDLLPDASAEQRLATAFHRNTMTNDEGGTDNEEFRTAAVKDRVDTTFQVWMGLTMGCARCHSHKYDPIRIQDYYAFFAFFNQTADADRSDDAPLLSSPTAEQAEKIARLEESVKSLGARLQDESDAAEIKTLKNRLEQTRKSLDSTRGSIPRTPVMQELPVNRRRKTQIHKRGNFLDPGDVVEPAVPEVFGPWPGDAPLNRLGVARWLVQQDNPLTARVMTNRIWARLFGSGFVETEEDFGTQGLPPSHPELLDWLAVDFREQDWSIKTLLRTIVLSATYRQTAEVTAARLTGDPDNRWFSRGPRFRLSAETVRDQALAVSGLLTQQIGGPSVMPPQPDGVWKSTYSNLKWVSATGPDRYRRGLYTYWKRTSPYPAMLTFDAGSGETCLIRRVRTNTPLQALVTLNDPAFVEAAGALANRMLQTGDRTSVRMERGFRLVLTRPPHPEEVSRLVELHSELQADFKADPQAATNLLAAPGLKTGDPALVAVANVLLNLDETLMKP